MNAKVVFSKVDSLNCYIQDDVGYLTIDRPQYANAISSKMWTAIPVLMKELEGAGAKVVVLSGSGEYFASGADLDELKTIKTKEDAEYVWHSIRDTLNYIWNFSLPTIAAINGVCYGGGLLLALSCDLRYASNSARFSLPVAKLGIALDRSNLARLSSVLGQGHLRELLFCASVIDAQRATQIGLVNELSLPTELTSLVEKKAKEIKRNALSSIQVNKSQLNEICAQGVENTELDLALESYLSNEFKARI